MKEIAGSNVAASIKRGRIRKGSIWIETRKINKVSAFHSRATGFGTNQEVIINFLECSGEVAGDDDFIEEGESAVVEFSLNTLEDLFLEGEIEQVEDDALILAEELATKDIISC